MTLPSGCTSEADMITSRDRRKDTVRIAEGRIRDRLKVDTVFCWKASEASWQKRDSVNDRDFRASIV